jgi:hypothetical protein
MFYKSLDGSTYEYLSPTASRRIIIVTKGSDGKARLCAEPPPDVAEAFAAAFAAGLQVAAQQGSDTTLGASGQTARQAATSIAPLLYRTQGIQFYRDSLWALCNDFLSNNLSPDEYVRLKSEVAEHARTLISSELALMKDAQIEFFKSVKAGGTTVDVSTVTKILEAAKTAQPKLPTTEK